METQQLKTMNIRSRNGDCRTHRLDIVNKLQIKHMQEFWLRATGQKVSETVLIRRAIDHYVNFIDELGSPEEIEKELRFLRDRAEGTESQIELMPVSPMESWLSFNERIVMPVLKTLKESITRKRNGHN